MSDTNPALESAVTLYSVGFYPLFERIGWDKAKELSLAADEIMLQNPLHMTGQQKFEVPELGPLTGAKIIALISAFLVWSQRKAGFTELPNSVFLNAANAGYELWMSQQKQTP